jgi:hypothetical protein
MFFPPPDEGRLATMGEAAQEYGANAGSERPQHAWILTPYDTWVRNPSYRGEPQPHPEDDAAWEAGE